MLSVYQLARRQIEDEEDDEEEKLKRKWQDERPICTVKQSRVVFSISKEFV